MPAQPGKLHELVPKNTPSGSAAARGRASSWQRRTASANSLLGAGGSNRDNWLVGFIGWLGGDAPMIRPDFRGPAQRVDNRMSELVGQRSRRLPWPDEKRASLVGGSGH